MNQDAQYEGRPYDGGAAAFPIKQPFLFFATGNSIYVSPRTPLPGDSALAQMKMTRGQYDSVVGLYQHNQDAALSRICPEVLFVSGPKRMISRIALSWT